MKTPAETRSAVPPELLQAIQEFPLVRSVTHCGVTTDVSPFALYFTCPQCGSCLKLRAFSAGAEIEDLFDAVFDWLRQPGAEALMRARQAELSADDMA
jgi:predicted RNA-binding Zn-ribbon protein involved in translation (DUF1610 family)